VMCPVSTSLEGGAAHSCRISWILLRSFTGRDELHEFGIADARCKALRWVADRMTEERCGGNFPPHRLFRARNAVFVDWERQQSGRSASIRGGAAQDGGKAAEIAVLHLGSL